MEKDTIPLVQSNCFPGRPPPAYHWSHDPKEKLVIGCQLEGSSVQNSGLQSALDRWTIGAVCIMAGTYGLSAGVLTT
jgi:hypothetical protein